MTRYLWWAVLILGGAWALWMLYRLFTPGAKAIVDARTGEVVGAKLGDLPPLRYKQDVTTGGVMESDREPILTEG